MKNKFFNELTLSSLILMACAYILKSRKGDRFYTGSCLDLNSRLLEHANKVYSKSFTTTSFGEWDLFISIGKLDYKQARQIELHIKRMKSKTFIKNLKIHPERISRLVERYKA